MFSGQGTDPLPWRIVVSRQNGHSTPVAIFSDLPPSFFLASVDIRIKHGGNFAPVLSTSLFDEFLINRRWMAVDSINHHSGSFPFRFSGTSLRAPLFFVGLKAACSRRPTNLYPAQKQAMCHPAYFLLYLDAIEIRYNIFLVRYKRHTAVYYFSQNQMIFFQHVIAVDA